MWGRAAGSSQFTDEITEALGHGINPALRSSLRWSLSTRALGERPYVPVTEGERVPMKPTLAVALALVAAGCVAAPAQDEASVQALHEALTLQECATQRDTCFSNNPFFGFFTCPLQYTQCVATADNGLPAQVSSAITAAAACARAETSCLRNATNTAQRLACTQTAAECVADIVDARLPQVVSGTLECVDGTLTCIRASETANDLAGCADTLEECALTQVVSVLPPAVGEVVEDVGECLMMLDDCIEAADSPADLAACNQAQVRCIAGSLDVPLPQIPVAEALQCAETAAECTLEARSIDEVQECAADLVTCNARLTDPEAELTCEQRWTQCLLRNPFAFFQCSADLTACRNDD